MPQTELCQGKMGGFLCLQKVVDRAAVLACFFYMDYLALHLVLASLKWLVLTVSVHRFVTICLKSVKRV